MQFLKKIFTAKYLILSKLRSHNSSYLFLSICMVLFVSYYSIFWIDYFTYKYRCTTVHFFYDGTYFLGRSFSFLVYVGFFCVKSQDKRSKPTSDSSHSYWDLLFRTIMCCERCWDSGFLSYIMFQCHIPNMGLSRGYFIWMFFKKSYLNKREFHCFWRLTCFKIYTGMYIWLKNNSWENLPISRIP